MGTHMVCPTRTQRPHDICPPTIAFAPHVWSAWAHTWCAHANRAIFAACMVPRRAHHVYAHANRAIFAACMVPRRAHHVYAHANRAIFAACRVRVGHTTWVSMQIVTFFMNTKRKALLIFLSRAFLFWYPTSTKTYRFVYCGALRARFRPGFLRSFMRESRVR